MNNEKQTNWKEKLAELDSLPDETEFDRHIAWEQLHKRLHNQRPRRKKVWYWVAAAVLVLVGLPLLVKKTGSLPPAYNLVKANPSAVRPPVAPVTQKEKLAVIVSTPVITRSLRQPSMKPTRKKTIPAPGTTLKAESITIANETPPIIVNTLPAGNEAVLAAVAPVKKKLAVVHINELGLQEKQNARYATHRRHTFIQINLLEQVTPALPLQTIPPGTDRLIKTTIPIKN